MNIQLKTLTIICVLLLLIGALVGRYTKSDLIKENTTIKTDEAKQIDRDTHIKIISTITKKPGGEEVTTTTTTKDSDTHIDDNKRTDEVISKITDNKPKVNLSLLVATRAELPIIPIYGLFISKDLFGPISVGAFALTNATFGLSVGVNF